MTGRRSHGRLSALNGVVHQGISSHVTRRTSSDRAAVSTKNSNASLGGDPTPGRLHGREGVRHRAGGVAPDWDAVAVDCSGGAQALNARRAGQRCCMSASEGTRWIGCANHAIVAHRTRTE